jgi:damage-control phosphatase, subfamily I
MQPMEIRPECEDCLKRLVELTVAQATADPVLQQEARRASLEIMARELKPEAIPAGIANQFHHAIMAVTGNPDPFATRKAAETAYLGRMYREIAATYGDDLESLLKLAAVGNAIDFFRDEAEVTRELTSRVEFGLSDLERGRRQLEGPPGLLLYLADNAGEQFFDAPLVAHLRGRGWRVLYVVKPGPIQNDLTREDLDDSGLGAALEPVVDTGARTVGLEMDRATPAFLKLFEAAQFILAKGMGHFETLSHLADPRLYFLLQAKCDPVARALGVARRSFVFCRTPAISLDRAGRTG